MSARSLMVMGTASDVGKSVVVTALCRAFARAGVRVAPFKSQNMSNNAAVCPGGGEIGRAQAVQAQACGLEPSPDMNPVLLKTQSGMGCQVVIRGRARFQMGVNDYERYRTEAWPEIVSSYSNLARDFELIVIEGAGSAAEINLRHRDIVNWEIAELADAPVLLVADIDKGGVFASIVGTIELLAPEERRRVKGVLINKFRGDQKLLEPGLRFLEQRTGIPILGVIPWQQSLGLPQEDAASLVGIATHPGGKPITIGVIHLPSISNYTDFDAFEDEPDVAVHYLSDPAVAPRLDVLIIPGTKDTVADLKWLRATGWENLLVRHRRAGGWVLGICGGYQMLGRRVIDADGVESDTLETIGLGLLEMETIFQGGKITDRIRAIHLPTSIPVSGYEIHSGRITGVTASRALFRLTHRDSSAVNELEGARSDDGRVIGTSIHGMFDSAGFRRNFLDEIRTSKGLAPLESAAQDDTDANRRTAFDRIADALEASVDMAQVAALAGVSLR
ncbi:cobyric acid synthase [Candidatus Binatus sp.]|uniref:cobyric acid synthase n=1 Tax=Candidatus Binatus sp. TaxID=2811406 RepID=UPI002F958C2B